MMNSTHPTEYLTKQQLESLAQDPSNIVYTYEDTTSDANATEKPSDEVKDLMYFTRSQYLVLRERHPDYPDTWVRKQLTTSSVEMASFAQSHELIFNHITSATTPESHLRVLEYMLYVKKNQQQNSHVSNDDFFKKHILQYLAKVFNTGKTVEQYEQEKKNQDQELEQLRQTEEAKVIRKRQRWIQFQKTQSHLKPEGYTNVNL